MPRCFGGAIVESGLDDGALDFTGCFASRNSAGSFRVSDRDLSVAFATSVANMYLSFVVSCAETALQPSLSAPFAAPLLREVVVVAAGFVRLGFKFSFCTVSFDSGANNCCNVSTVAGVHVEMDATSTLMF